MQDEGVVLAKLPEGSLIVFKRNRLFRKVGLMFANSRGVHAGVDGPAYVFGRRNLDYKGPNLTGSISDDVANDPAGDFAEPKAKYGSFGSLSDKEEEQRRNDVSREFLKFLFDENEMNLENFFRMEDEDSDDLMAEFVNGRKDTVADDFERLAQEYGENGFEKGIQSLRDTLEEESQYQFFTDEYADKVADTSSGKPWKISTELPNPEKAYYDDVLAGEFIGSFEEYERRGFADKAQEEQRLQNQKEIGELIGSWHEDALGKNPDSHPYLLVAEYSDEWERVEGLDGRLTKPTAISASWLEKYNTSPDYIFNWGRDKYDDPRRSYSQGYLRRKDGTLELAVLFDNGEEERMLLRPMNSKKQIQDGNNVVDIPDSPDKMRNFVDKRSTRITEYLDSLDQAGKLEEVAEAFHDLDPEAASWGPSRNILDVASGKKIRGVSREERIATNKLLDIYSKKYGEDNPYNERKKEIQEYLAKRK